MRKPRKLLKPELIEFQEKTLDDYLNYPNEVEAEFYTKVYAELSNDFENDRILSYLNSINKHSHKIELLPLLDVKKYVIDLDHKTIDFLYNFFNECYAVSNTISCDLDRRKPHSVEAKKITEILKVILNNKIGSTENENVKYKEQNLFKIGLLFAQGRLNKYFELNKNDEIIIKQGYTAPKITDCILAEFNIKINHKYISATFNNYSKDNPNGNKNIFNSSDMMNKIISHCKENKIDVDAYFLNRLPIE